MAYYVTFYCSIGDVGCGQALDQVVAESGSRRGVRLHVAHSSSGDGWAAANFGSTPENADAGGVHMEIHTSAALVVKMVEQVSVDGLPLGISDSDMVAILTLSGNDVDWPAVRSTWRSTAQLWGAIPYDDVSGFDVSIESLG